MCKKILEKLFKNCVYLDLLLSLSFSFYCIVPEAVVNLTVVPSNLTFNVTWQRPETPNGDIIQYNIEWISDVLTCSDFLLTPGQNAASVSSCTVHSC